ncbi:OmpA family protein [Dyella silvatica]|uniref:OmpA family protein n=1 Tax=Dyella silvatica TaxID=2992128 RepID=UPI00224D9DA5|nr:OmpA family protein [Dyella silvatica]
MNRKGLYFVIALALGGVGAAHAQNATSTPSYDGRWYIAPTVGGYYNDTDRNTNSRQFYYGLGVGRFIAPNVSIDLFIDRTKRDRDNPNGPGHSHSGNWANNNYGVAARYYFGAWDSYRPYLLAGVMGSYHRNANNKGWAPAAELGAGVSKTITDSTDIRVEAGYRYDWDDKSQTTTNSANSRDGYGDWFLGLSLVSRFGEPAAAPVAPVAPPPVAPDCSKTVVNGVNLCDNKCPNTPEGTVVGPDGCPIAVVIDLRGVNFKFDRPKKGETNIEKTLAEPSADSLSILDQAVDTLKRYPNVQVNVAGYTDGVGKAAYNQGLSERRAKIVYDYLTSHGVDASRLQGPVGHGMNDPVDSNKTEQGRARNRRTELQVQK